MSSWMQFWLLSALTGNPLLAASLVLVGWFVVDRFTVRALPDPIRVVLRWSRTHRLKRLIEMNRFDRKSRFELAELYVEQRRFAAAVELLRPNLEAGDHDAGTLFLMGVACLGAKHIDQGELLLTSAQEEDPHFRMGEIDLARGRWRLVRGDWQGAREALDRFCAARPGTVEGKVLLAKAQEKLGNHDAAYDLRDRAWWDHAAAPRFAQRLSRFWAWRAKPWRPVLYAVLLAAGATLFFKVAGPTLERAANPYRPGAPVIHAADDDE